MRNNLDRFLLFIDYLMRVAVFIPIRFKWMIRNAKFRRELKSLGGRVRIGEDAVIFPLNKVSIGDNVVIHGPVFIEANAGVEIGSNVAIARGCRILTSNHIYDGDALPWSENSQLKPVVLENNVWIGLDVLILPGVTVHEGAIIGAGSVVTRNVPKCAIACGNPARVIKYRNIEMYEQNKLNSRFRKIPIDIARHTLLKF